MDDDMPSGSTTSRCGKDNESVALVGVLAKSVLISLTFGHG